MYSRKKVSLPPGNGTFFMQIAIQRVANLAVSFYWQEGPVKGWQPCITWTFINIANNNIYLITTFTHAKNTILSLIPCFGISRLQ